MLWIVIALIVMVLVGQRIRAAADKAREEDKKR